MAQQTAVEWLYNQLDGFSDEEWYKIDKTFEQAKQMEKEQMIDLTQTLTSTPSDISREMAVFIVESFINREYGK